MLNEWECMIYWPLCVYFRAMHFPVCIVYSRALFNTHELLTTKVLATGSSP